MTQSKNLRRINQKQPTIKNETKKEDENFVTDLAGKAR